MDATIRLNGENRPWTEQSLRALVAGTGVDPEQHGVAVARNGDVVPRADWAQTQVKPDDKIEIVHIVRGG